MQQNSIKALHQNRNPLKLIAGLSSLASIDGDPPFKISQELASWLLLLLFWDEDVIRTLTIGVNAQHLDMSQTSYSVQIVEQK